MHQELQVIKSQIAVDLLALERILEILQDRGEDQPYLERAVSALGSGLDDLDYAIKQMRGKR